MTRFPYDPPEQLGSNFFTKRRSLEDAASRMGPARTALATGAHGGTPLRPKEPQLTDVQQPFTLNEHMRARIEARRKAAADLKAPRAPQPDPADSHESERDRVDGYIKSLMQRDDYWQTGPAATTLKDTVQKLWQTAYPNPARTDATGRPIQDEEPALSLEHLLTKVQVPDTQSSLKHMQKRPTGNRILDLLISPQYPGAQSRRPGQPPDWEHIFGRHEPNARDGKAWSDSNQEIRSPRDIDPGMYVDPGPSTAVPMPDASNGKPGTGVSLAPRWPYRFGRSVINTNDPSASEGSMPGIGHNSGDQPTPTGAPEGGGGDLPERSDQEDRSDKGAQGRTANPHPDDTSISPPEADQSGVHRQDGESDEDYRTRLYEQILENLEDPNAVKQIADAYQNDFYSDKNWFLKLQNIGADQISNLKPLADTGTAENIRNELRMPNGEYQTPDSGSGIARNYVINQDGTIYHRPPPDTKAHADAAALNAFQQFGLAAENNSGDFRKATEMAIAAGAGFGGIGNKKGRQKSGSPNQTQPVVKGKTRPQIPSVSKTENPMEKREYDSLPENGKVDPKRIRTTQDTISRRFRDGKSLEETRDDFAAGKADDIPPIRIYERDGKISTLDHRRLIAAREAGTDIRYRKATPSEVSEDFPTKNTTLDDGRSVQIINNNYIYRRNKRSSKNE